MYSRKLSGKVLEFGHEGVLYRRSFVMYDRGTQSLWVHTTGECVKGELKGAQLTFINSSITSWGNWLENHPNSLVLEGKGRGGFMGTFTLKEKDAKKFGVSVGQGSKAKLFLMEDLLRERVIQDRFDGKDIVVFFDKEGMHATAWVRGNHKFAYRMGEFVDEAGRPWNTMLGKPKGSTSDSQKMQPLPATAWLIKRWHGFYPESPIWDSNSQGQNQEK